MLTYKIQFFRIIVYKFISVNDLVYHNILKQGQAYFLTKKYVSKLLTLRYATRATHAT